MSQWYLFVFYPTESIHLYNNHKRLVGFLTKITEKESTDKQTAHYWAHNVFMTEVSFYSVSTHMTINVGYQICQDN